MCIHVLGDIPGCFFLVENWYGKKHVGCERHLLKLMLSGFGGEGQYCLEVWDICRCAHHYMMLRSGGPRYCTG